MEAVSKVRLDLEELPAVFDVEEALKSGAPILKEWGTNYFVYEGHHCRRVRFGDIDQGFQDADFIIEDRYQTSPIEHAPSETTGCIAKPEADGRITVYSNTQALFFTLDNTALILQVPFQKLHFVGGTVGGGFGGKVDVIVEPIATLAAMKTNRPVKYMFSRQEEMQVSSSRGAWRMYFKDGVMKDGRIIAIGDLGNEPASNTLDIKDQVVAPGFIDTHSHANQALSSPETAGIHGFLK